MQVFELLDKLQRYPAGAEVEVSVTMENDDHYFGTISSTTHDFEADEVPINTVYIEVKKLEEG